ncbi:uncharacterized protein LOC144432038 [Styela clava]
MPLTAAERQKRFRERQKAEGKIGEFKLKQKEYVRRSREQSRNKENNLSVKEQNMIKQKRRNAVKMRVAKHRLMKKQAKENHAPFKSALAFAKASARAKRMMRTALPSTPNRQKAVVRKLYWEILDKEQQGNPSTDRKRRTGILESTVNAVADFYRRDDISRQAPGKKDVISIKKDGFTERLQTRHLTSSIAEVYQIFRDEFPHLKIGRSKFAELRPKNVFLSSRLPHNVCLCKYHENFICAINSLHKVIPEFPSYTTNIVNTFVCASPNLECWKNVCMRCKDGAGFKMSWGAVLEGFENKFVSWYVWENSVSDSRLKKVQEEGDVNDLLEHVYQMLPQFLEHSYIKRQQSMRYKLDRDNTLSTSASYSNSEALIQIDFAENYTCVNQDEIQSAHWQQQQISIFTAAAWYGGKNHSMAVVSDYLCHSKEAVIPILSKILSTLPSFIKSVKIWSDGPSSQFKNKYILASLPALESVHNISISWNFFATSHGKGPVDGIGGSVKRYVWNQVRCRKHHVIDAKSFTEATMAIQNIKCMEITREQIKEISYKLDLEKIFAEASSVHGISKIHHMEVKNGQLITSFLTGDINVDAAERSTQGSSVKIGDWVAVRYEGNLYPGEVTCIQNNEFKVSVMERDGKNWKWPITQDSIFYMNTDIVEQLEKPIPINNRGHYVIANFSELEHRVKAILH